MSNAVQIRDASDITKYKKDRLIYQHYVQLQAKSQLPVGGIPHEHLMAVARANDRFIPTSSILPTVTASGVTSNVVSYNTSQVIATTCDPTCSSGGAYMAETYPNEF